MATKIKKKIIKKIVECVEPVFENDSTPFEAEDEPKQFNMPESLSYEKIKSQIEKIKKEDEARDIEKASFKAPEGYTIAAVIEHGYYNIEDEVPSATKELIFWKKYKPERYYELVRHGNYVTYIICRPATKAEQAENLKRKRS